MTVTEFRRLWWSLTDTQRKRIQAKAQWEQMSLLAIIQEWPQMVKPAKAARGEP